MPSGDVVSAPKIAHAAGDALLQLSAYDYALAGGYAGEKTRIVSYARYAAVARGLLPKVSDVISTALAATANAAGPVRNSVVALADALNALAKDTGTYADAGEPATFAKVMGDVASGWDRLQALAATLPPDPDLQKTISRGTSFTVSSRSDPLYALTAGPYATAADADAAAKKIGAVVSVTRAAPFVIRVATYPTRAQADAAATALKPKGIDITAVSEERTYAFARGPVAPDIELWREPARIFDTWSGARRVAMSPDGKWLATGSDDGTVAIFSADGGLQSLPRFSAGISQLLFSSDGTWLLAGGAVTATFSVPAGVSTGSQMRFPAAVSQAVFIGIPGGRAFIAVSKGATGLPSGGGGTIGARAPDGAVLGAPFPVTTPAAGGFLAASDRGELFVATTSAGGTDVEVLRLGADRTPRGVVRVPGVVSAFATDPRGDRGAIVTDQGTFRVLLHDPNPMATLAKVGVSVREVAFGADGTLYLLEKEKLTALSADGALRWQVPLTDGRRLLVGSRTVVLDAPDAVLAIAADGTIDGLGVDGTAQDLALSSDGKRVAVVVEARRAVVFNLQ
ncbi:MAG TPA: hypothetical protein VHG53_04490 [Candidatus Limnocylindria bacterium]|nr:hypothetical protein [Candidatus Limnocylindria bacterium]